MNIIAVDDEVDILNELKELINEAYNGTPVNAFTLAEGALNYAENNCVDVAFLDIEMHNMSGLDLAKRLKEINPKTNIIFVTGHPDYGLKAISMHASGYILKPFTEEDIIREIKNLRFPPSSGESRYRLRIQTFGNFEAFAGGEPLCFPRSKSKELLAYLVHKRGTGCTIKELAITLFEDDGLSQQKQMQIYIATMMKVLEAAGAKDIIIKNYNSLSVDVTKLDCDLYKFLQSDPEAINSYMGEYMANYSWAEIAIGYFDGRIINNMG